MSDVLKYLGQAFVYAIIAVGTAYFASRPQIQLLRPDAAQIKLSLAHSAQRKEECRKLTSAEIAKLPPSQRRPNTCGRERVPMHVQLVLDGQAIYDATIEPIGLSADGPARVYKKFVVPSGRHQIVARLKDRLGGREFDYEKSAEINLSPSQSLAIEFKADRGGFLFY